MNRLHQNLKVMMIVLKNNIKDAGYTKAIDFIDNFNKINQ